MQPDLSEPTKNKEELLYFEKADFSTMRKINNASILEMMKYDAHLRDTPRICPTNLKDRFGELIARYISAEREGIEEELDYCLTQLSSLFLGSTSSEDVRDFRFMDLHLRVQRYLRNPIYRSHTAHLLGVCLFSNLLLEADIDLLTLARTEYFFQALRSLDINKPKRNQEESKPTYYPGDIGSEMDRGVYPSGELFAVKLRKYLERKKEEDLKKAVCFFFDPFIWINLYHDWGYIYELEHLYSEGIYKNNKPPEAIEEIINELNREKDEIEKEANFDLNRYFPNKNGIENALKCIFSPSLNKEEKKEEIKGFLNSKNENEEAERALDYILSFPLCPDKLKKERLRKMVREKLSIKYDCKEIERALDCLLPSYLFSWDNISECAKERLRRFLVDDLNIDYAENADISKSPNERTISILKDGNSAKIAEITLYEKEEKATLKITDGKTYVLKVKEEKGKRNIYLPPFDESDEDQKDKLIKVVSKILTSKIKNHGIVSSLILYDKFLNIFKNAQVAERIPSDLIKYKEDALKDELGAICLHDLNLYENKITLRLTDSPHYFLLKFADVISDWGRTYKGKVSLYDFSILDHILFGFNPTECTKPNGEKFEEDTRGILVNIIFDFSNNERLLADEIGLKDKSKNSYPRKENYEFEEFVKKREELQSLDYFLEIDGKKYQWFFFNLILIDRYGERFLIENSKNNVDLWWIIPPLFSEKFKKLKIKELSRFDYKKGEFEHDLDTEKKR